MEYPLISVIVPIYNEENNIKNCIDSLLKQNYPSFELLLVDDGSQDRSGSIIDDYAAKYGLIRAYHKKNGGACSARNFGMEVARGEWIAFCDSDDYVTPDWLRLSAVHLNERTGLVVQPFLLHAQAGKKQPDEGKAFEGNVFDFLENYFDMPMVGSNCTKLFSLAVIRKNQLRFNESFKLREDEEFLVRYLKLLEQDARVVCTLSGGYLYDMPVFSVKYKRVDNFFETLLSVYLVIKSMHKASSIPKAHAYALKSLTHALWDLFLFSEKVAWKSLNIYHKEVKSAILNISSFPLMFRMILCLPCVVAFPCLKIMGTIIHQLKH